MKSLIAYYSRKGENYVSGSIINLAEGNTEVVAKKIQQLVGADLFHIETEQDYPADYIETTRVAQDELNADARPELAENLASIEEYDTIYLGYPNWWGTAPMAVFSFLESHNFSGKTIMPFCTHEGSGLGQSEANIQLACPDADVKKGLAIKGSAVKKADAQIEGWVK
ncbi:MAG: flavodoxin [Mangrovibacterium sp.]